MENEVEKSFLSGNKLLNVLDLLVISNFHNDMVLIFYSVSCYTTCTIMIVYSE